MELVAEDHDGFRVVKVAEPRIDAAIAIRFKDAVRTAAGDAAPRVVLDLSNVTFLDSSGLGALVAAMKLLGPTRRLELAGLTANVERVFRLTRMDTVFTIHPSIAVIGDTGTRLADAG
jgi:anti-sigma B factor antagonist